MIKSDIPNKTYTQKDLDEARHQGYKIAENLHSEQVRMLKEEIKRLKDAL